MTSEHKQNNISNDLIEAYKDYYEGGFNPDVEETFHNWVIEKIRNDSPKKRLRVYLEWNGVIGYHNRIWEITQGEL